MSNFVDLPWRRKLYRTRRISKGRSSFTSFPCGQDLRFALKSRTFLSVPFVSLSLHCHLRVAFLLASLFVNHSHYRPKWNAPWKKFYDAKVYAETSDFSSFLPLSRCLPRTKSIASREITDSTKFEETRERERERDRFTRNSLTYANYRCRAAASVLPRGSLCAWRLCRSIWRRFLNLSLSIVAPNVTLRARDEAYATRTDITHDREQLELREAPSRSFSTEGPMKNCAKIQPCRLRDRRQTAARTERGFSWVASPG